MIRGDLEQLSDGIALYLDCSDSQTRLGGLQLRCQAFEPCAGSIFDPLPHSGLERPDPSADRIGKDQGALEASRDGSSAGKALEGRLGEIKRINDAHGPAPGFA